MSGEVVEVERTVFSVTALYLAIRVAVRNQTGADMPRASLMVLVAHSCLETNNGLSSNNWNLGGIKSVPGDGRNYTTYLTREVIKGQSVTLTQRFRAYASLQEGAEDFVHLVHTTFGYAWPAVEAVDVDDYAHRLRARGYFTADEGQYSAGLKARYALVDAKIPPDTLPEIPPLAPDNAPSLDLEAEEVGGEGPGPDAA